MQHTNIRLSDDELNPFEALALDFANLSEQHPGPDDSITATDKCFNPISVHFELPAYALYELLSSLLVSLESEAKRIAEHENKGPHAFINVDFATTFLFPLLVHWYSTQNSPNPNLTDELESLWADLSLTLNRLGHEHLPDIRLPRPSELPYATRRFQTK